MRTLRNDGILLLAVAALLIAVVITPRIVVAAAEERLEFTFGVVPQFEARELASIWVPIFQALEKETGYKLRMVGAPRIPDFERAFEAGEFDFAYMNPYHSLTALREQGYKPLVRDDSDLYGVLVVGRESQVTDIQQLQGETIAFPAPNALGASLLMRAELSNVHGINHKSLYAQTHTSSYLNVLLGETSAAGGVMKTFQQLPAEIQERLRIIYETRHIPSHPVVAHPRVPEAAVIRVQKAIIKLANTAEGAQMLSRIPMKNPIVTNLADYEKLSEWGLEKFYVNPGN
jgi:phosphonate transport system substrate-binding protein